MTNSSEALYDEFWSNVGKAAKFHPANRFRYHLIAATIGGLGKTPATVLDVGCGNGSLLTALRELLPAAKLYGCDVSPQQIEADRAALPGMAFFQADAAILGLQERMSTQLPRQYDLVVSSEVIEHVRDDDAFLTNLAALVAPGGFLVLTTQSGKRYRMDKEILGHLRHYRRADLVHGLTARGLEVRHASNCGFPVLTMQKIAVEMMFEKATKAAASGNEPSPLMKAIMNAMFVTMKLSPRIAGPQLLLLAQRPA